MHIHILGICGTFMGGLALLAKAKGFDVSGSDSSVYPPMSTQLESSGITLIDGYDASYFKDNKPDLIVIGNALSRGNSSVEHILNEQLPYCSGPEFISQHILKDKWVLAVAGTHGKTTTTSMLAWILEYAKLKPGFLIGGVPQNFGVSARLGDAPFFIIEADEYDTAFFDKRSKFVHYHPRTLILNNLEFDHADIFENLAAIKRQFHHLVRIVPAKGQIILPLEDDNLRDVMDMGNWSETTYLSTENKKYWWTNYLKDDGSEFEVGFENEKLGTVKWNLIGDHNVNNCVAAIAAARHVGVMPKHAISAMAEFINTKRRMELLSHENEVSIYDDFAHHPTAISSTLDGLRKKVGSDRIIVVLEPRSNTMKLGTLSADLSSSLMLADKVVIFQDKLLSWDAKKTLADIQDKLNVFDEIDNIVNYLLNEIKTGDHVVIMSNGGFGGIHTKLVSAINSRENF